MSNILCRYVAGDEKITEALKVHMTVIPTSKELHSKDNIDKVNGVERKTPEIIVSGDLNKYGSLVDKPLNGNKSTSILAGPPNFRKEMGAIMSVTSDEGFVKLPRSLWNDPQWKSARPKYKLVFMTLLFNASFTQKTFSISNNIVTIGPGQFCTSIRNLIDLCNDGIKFKEDKVDKNIVERSVSLFTKIGFVRQEVRHGKSIFTITHNELYEHFQKQSETGSETKVRQNRDTNEERKERKEIEETIEGAVALDSSLMNLEKEEQKKDPSIFQPETPKEKVELNPEKQKHFENLWKFVIENKIAVGMTSKPGIKEKDLITWLKTYDAKEILECLNLAIKASIKSTYGGYVATLLKDRIAKREEDSKQGRKFVEEFIKKNKIDYIELKKDYFSDLISDEQSYYYLPIITLDIILKKCKQKAQEREEQERSQRDYEYSY